MPERNEMKRTSFSAKGDAAPARSQAGGHPSIEIITSPIGSDRLIDLILQNAGDLIVMLDQDGKRIYNSPSYPEVDLCSRIVLASGYLDPELKSQFFTLGAKAFLQKPSQPDDTLRVIPGVIEVSGHVEKGVPS